MAEQEFLPFALPDVTEAEIEAVAVAMRSGWLTMGPVVRDFEEAFATRVGIAHAIAVNSCTSALHLALEAVGIGAGDEVIVPTMTFAATAEVVRYLGARPVLADIRRDDQCIDIDAVERLLTPKVRAIIPVHFAGQPADMDPLLEIARDRGVAVIEDAAHSLPAQYRGREVGTIGDITCFSFYATKTMTTGEGGMATTANPSWAERMKCMRLHGISKDAWKRYSAEGSWYYEIVAPGFKYNTTDPAAAMGMVQLRRLGTMYERRRAIAERYRDAFAKVDALELLAKHDDRSHAWHLFVVRLVHEALSIERSAFIDALRGLGIGTSVHFIPLHLHPYYRNEYGHAAADFPVATDAYERSLSLPIYSTMTDRDVDRVIDAVLGVVRTHHR